jgi:hypothetical protein
VEIPLPTGEGGGEGVDILLIPAFSRREKGLFIFYGVIA